MPVYNPASKINPISIQALATPTAMAWKVLPTSFAVGVPFQVQVRCTATVAMPSIPIHFYLDGVDQGTQWTSAFSDPNAQTGGYSAWTYTIAVAGSHTLMATFPGNSSFSGSQIPATISVGAVTFPTAITLISPATASQGSAFNVNGVLTYTDLAGVVQPLAGRTVTVAVTDGTTIASVNVVTDASGAYAASISSNTAGALNVVASYAGETTLGLGSSYASMSLDLSGWIVPALIVGVAILLSRKKRR